MKVTRICDLDGLPYTMNPTLPAKFGLLVEQACHGWLSGLRSLKTTYQRLL